MHLLIHGSNKKAVGIFEPPFYTCPRCDQLHTTYIVIYSVYFHFFWIPAFPYRKEAIATCSECGFWREEIKFGPMLIKEFEEKKNEYKHPWWAYSLTLLFGLLIVLAIVL
jgi:hypothetical protein